MRPWVRGLASVALVLAAACGVLLWSSAKTSPQHKPAQVPRWPAPQPTDGVGFNSTVTNALAPPFVVIADEVTTVAGEDLTRKAVPSLSAAHDGLGRRTWGSTIFAVLSDPVYVEPRLRAMLRTWLSPATHSTLVYFSGTNRSRSVAVDHAATADLRDGMGSVPNRNATEVRRLRLPTDVALLRSPNAAWKNFAVLRDLMVSFPPGNVSSPRWFAIVDDDTYVMGGATSHHLAAAPATAYLGHYVLHCPFCRHRAKQFPFVYGGNGIFMTPPALAALGALLPQCNTTFVVGAGDERVGACAKLAKLPLTRVEGGCEGYLQALAEGASEFVRGSEFPFAFHRIARPELFDVLWALERRHPGAVVSWAALAQWVLVPSVDACALPWSLTAQNRPRRCLPLNATPADWYPRTHDHKAKRLQAHAWFEQHRRRR